MRTRRHGPSFGAADLIMFKDESADKVIAYGNCKEYECGITSKQRNDGTITEHVEINNLTQTLCQAY